MKKQSFDKKANAVVDYISNAKFDSSNMDSFLHGAKKTLGDRVNLDKPFETLFSLLGPTLVWSFSWPLGIVVFLADAAGWSLGGLGKLIDDALGKGSGEGPKEITEEGLMGAAQKLIDNVVTTDSIAAAQENVVQKEATAMLRDIKEIKGYVTKNDIFVSLAYAQNNGFVKHAAAIPMVAKSVLRYTGKEQLKKGLFGVLWRFLLRAAKYLGWLSVVGGATEVVKTQLGISDRQTESKRTNDYYKNTQNDVEKTLIQFLNTEFDFDYKGKVLSFSELYKLSTGQNIEGSKPMEEALYSVRLLNGGKQIEEINEWEAFTGPLMDDLFKMFFPNIPVPGEEAQVAVPEKQAPKKQAPGKTLANKDQQIVNLFLELKGA